MTKLENVLVWLYVKTWGKFGDHVIDEDALWKFSAEDLRKTITKLAHPRKRNFKEQEKSERVKALTALIMEKFENVAAFNEWSDKIYQDNKENIPKQLPTVKISEWDPGNYCFFFYKNRPF